MGWSIGTNAADRPSSDKQTLSGGPFWRIIIFHFKKHWNISIKRLDGAQTVFCTLALCGTGVVRARGKGQGTRGKGQGARAGYKTPIAYRAFGGTISLIIISF